ncbi:hypothetical protein D3C73_1151490 [compost metagenome]
MAIHTSKGHRGPVGNEQEVGNVEIRRAVHHVQRHCHIQPGQGNDPKEPADQKVGDAAVVKQETGYQEARQGKKNSHAHNACSGIQLQTLWAEG